MKIKPVARCADGQDADRALDWLTALSPLLLMMVVNYHWSAVWATLTATAGYAAMTVLWQWLDLMPCRVAPALLCGVLVACCLPSTAPVWLSALVGLAAALVAVIPTLLNRLLKKTVVSCPVYAPPLIGYLAMRWVFPTAFVAFTVPAMWAPVDAVASATPLAALGVPDAATDISHLFWGYEAGSMGGGPAVAILLGCVYLLLRRRIHPLPVVGMAAMIALLSWLCWDRPLYSLLGGGTLLACVLAGEEGFARVGWKGRLVGGALAGVVTVLCRLWWRLDGSAVGVLSAALVMPILHGGYHLLRRYIPLLWQKMQKTKNKG